MAFRFVAIVAALACVATANPIGFHGHGAAVVGPIGHNPCPRVLPEIVPQVVQSVIPAPVNIGPQAPGVIEHASAPYEINYFEKPWVVKHLKSAGLNVFTQTPVVVDEYAAPAFNEGPAPAAVIVEPVCGAPAAAVGAYAGYAGAGYAGAAYGHGVAPLPAPVALPAPVVAAAPCH